MDIEFFIGLDASRCDTLPGNTSVILIHRISHVKLDCDLHGSLDNYMNKHCGQLLTRDRLLLIIFMVTIAAFTAQE